MSMNSAFKIRTVCEILREINDMCQDNSQGNQIIRNKLALAESMTKRMSQKLDKYKTELSLNRDNDFHGLEINIDFDDDLKRRQNRDYKYEVVE